MQTEEFYRQKLIRYAESFRELSECFDEPFPKRTGERESAWEERRSWENRQVIREHFLELSNLMWKAVREGDQIGRHGNGKKRDWKKWIQLTGYARAIRDKEEISGDNFAFFQGPGGYFYAILSDGTGSGEKAGKESEQVLDLMENLLEVDYPTEIAIELVNTAVFSKVEDGNHPTLDICEVDMSSGVARFYKIGGTDSFIVGEKGISRIPGQNLPLGIFSKVESKPVERILQNGDYILLLSDGVADAFDKEGIAPEVDRRRNPKETAERILQEAIRLEKGRIADDMMVLVVAMWENGELS